jgi:hypothetical protein
MSEGWLEISDPEVNAAQVASEVRRRMNARDQPGDASPNGLDADAADPIEVADAVFQSRFGRSRDGPFMEGLADLARDCEIVPENYAIDWRVPIIGRAHAAVRRVINAEIRRYLLPMLQKQGYINKRLLEALARLEQENVELRRKLERLGDQE